MTTLAWFVQEALDHSSIPHSEWEGMARQKQTEVLTKWQTDCEIKFNVVAASKFKRQGTKNIDPISTSVVLSYETAEYLTCLTGQTRWGDRDRRRKVNEELGQAVKKMTNAQDCFSKIAEDQCPQCGKRM